MNGIRPDHQGFDIIDASWATEREALLSVREAVFIHEQRVAREIEIDGRDGDCEHVLAVDRSGNPIGTARLDRGGHVGRVAVLAGWRGLGVGVALMKSMARRARELGFGKLELNSQSHAAGFYERLGYARIGEEFEEAGIPHVKMVADL